MNPRASRFVASSLFSALIALPAAWPLTPPGAQSSVPRQYVLDSIPAASTRQVFQPPGFADSNQTIGGWINRLSVALTADGYSEQGWYVLRFPNEPWGRISGVMVFTRVDKIDASGRRLEGRARVALTPDNADTGFWAALQALLFGAPPGKYRGYGFAVTHGPASQVPSPLTLDLMQKWLVTGARAPTFDVLNGLRFEGDWRCIVLVYEFTKSSADGRVSLESKSETTVADHLTAGGLSQVNTLIGPHQ